MPDNNQCTAWWRWKVVLKEAKGYLVTNMSSRLNPTKNSLLDTQIPACQQGLKKYWSGWSSKKRQQSHEWETLHQAPECTGLYTIFAGYQNSIIDSRSTRNTSILTDGSWMKLKKERVRNFNVNKEGCKRRDTGTNLNLAHAETEVMVGVLSGWTPTHLIWEGELHRVTLLSS